MARPKSEDKRAAIVAAAIRVIAAQGLGAPTATIAKEAGVSNGSLFTYFETKTDLLNQTYVELKMEMGAVAAQNIPTEDDNRAQSRHLWNGWLHWATAYPEKRRALAQLDVSDAITAESHQAARRAFTDIRELMERSREHGPLSAVPLEFVVTLMSALAETTIDAMIHDPANAETYRTEGFAALWRMIA